MWRCDLGEKRIIGAVEERSPDQREGGKGVNGERDSARARSTQGITQEKHFLKTNDWENKRG